jgi:hypothetical protein
MLHVPSLSQTAVHTPTVQPQQLALLQPLQ